jgi:hypothetical protein
MNRMVNASPTNPSATSLNGLTPSSWGCRNPRLYSCVAIVDVLTWRNVSSTPSGSGSSSGPVTRSSSVATTRDNNFLPRSRP